MAGGSTRLSPSMEDAQTPMTPHLAQNDELPQDLQNRQGTTAAASTSAVSSSAIAAIAAAATATTLHQKNQLIPSVQWTMDYNLHPNVMVNVSYSKLNVTQSKRQL